MRKNVKHIIIIAIAIALIAIVNQINSSNLIVWFGVATVRILRHVISALLLIIIVLAAFLIIRNIIKMRKESVRTKSMPVINLEVTTNEGYNPEYIRQELNKNLAVVKGLGTEIGILLQQTDSMDRKEEKLKTILARNETRSLDSVENTLVNTEQAMFKNIIKIMNRIDLWDDSEYMLESKQEIYNEHRARIQVLIDKNNEMLNMTDILLSETIKYINTKDDSSESNMHLDSMIETMKSLTGFNEKS
ncbi:MAG: hypothetical protein ACK5LL_11310 [Suipraeoptans sp.]